MRRKICFLLALVMMTVSMSSMTAKAQEVEACKVFTDVKHDSWYEESVKYVYDKGIMSGSNGIFKPQDNITRAQLVTTLYRMAGEPTVRNRAAVEVFSDIEEGKYYTDAVCWAYSNSITTGSNGKFKPSDTLTREQLVVFLGRYSSMLHITYPNIFGLRVLNNFSDYARDDIFWAVGYGLITGNAVCIDDYYYLDVNPKGNATRAQVATILMRFCELYGA